jgi:serine/threonine-protein kinase
MGRLTPWRNGFIAGNKRGEIRVFASLQPGTTPQVCAVSRNPIEAPVFEHDDVFYVGDTGGVFWAFDPDTGIKWSYRTGNQIIGGAICCDGMIVVGSHDCSLYAFEPETGELKYSVECDGQINGAPLFLESQRAIVFGSCDGLLRKVDVRTGNVIAEINYESFLPETPTLYDGILYLLTRSFNEPGDDKSEESQGELAAVDALTFEELWRVPVKDMYLSAPFATGELLFLTSDVKGGINVHARKDGTPLATLPTDEKMTTLQAGDDSHVFAVSLSGKVYRWQQKNNQWHASLLAELQTDCRRSCVLLGDKNMVTDDSGGVFCIDGIVDHAK